MEWQIINNYSIGAAAINGSVDQLLFLRVNNYEGLFDKLICKK